MLLSLYEGYLLAVNCLKSAIAEFRELRNDGVTDYIQEKDYILFEKLFNKLSSIENLDFNVLFMKEASINDLCAYFSHKFALVRKQLSDKYNAKGERVRNSVNLDNEGVQDIYNFIHEFFNGFNDLFSRYSGSILRRTPFYEELISACINEDLQSSETIYNELFNALDIQEFTCNSFRQSRVKDKALKYLECIINILIVKALGRKDYVLRKTPDGLFFEKDYIDELYM